MPLAHSAMADHARKSSFNRDQILGAIDEPVEKPVVEVEVEMHGRSSVVEPPTGQVLDVEVVEGSSTDVEDELAGLEPELGELKERANRLSQQLRQLTTAVNDMGDSKTPGDEAVVDLLGIEGQTFEDTSNGVDGKDTLNVNSEVENAIIEALNEEISSKGGGGGENIEKAKNDIIIKISEENAIDPKKTSIISDSLDDKKEVHDDTKKSTSTTDSATSQDESASSSEAFQDASEVPPRKSDKEMTELLIGNVKPPKPRKSAVSFALSDSQSPSKSSSDESRMDPSISSPSSSSQCPSLESAEVDVSWRRSRRPEMLYSYPDMKSSRPKGRLLTGTYWHMPFRHRLYRDLTSPARKKEASSSEDESDSEEQLELCPADDWRPEIFAPTGDVYSYFQRRRVDPCGFSSPLSFSTLTSLGGRHKTYIY